MISHQKQFVFVHIPKCAGTSIESTLMPFTEGAIDSCKVLIRRNRNPLRGPPWLQHLTAEEYTRIGYITEKDWNSYYTFAIVRNPFARLVSEYNAKGKSRKMKLLRMKWNFRNFVLHSLPSWYEDNYLRGYDNYRHIIPQVRFVRSRNGTTMVNDIFKLEDMPGAFGKILEKLNLESVPIIHSNTSNYRDPDNGSRLLSEKLPYRDYYDSSTKAFVEKHYREDLDLFNYAF